MPVNSLAWADENKLKCEKVRFHSEMGEINSTWIIFNLYEWTFFKGVAYAKLHTLKFWEIACTCIRHNTEYILKLLELWIIKLMVIIL